MLIILAFFFAQIALLRSLSKYVRRNQLTVVDSPNITKLVEDGRELFLYSVNKTIISLTPTIAPYASLCDTQV